MNLASHKPLIILGLSLTLLIGTDYLNAWTAPTSGNPPTGNVSAPINTGSATQNKNGTLGVNALAVFGASTFTGATTFSTELALSETSPQIKFRDSDGMDFWTYVNSNSFYVLANRDSDEADWETPHPLTITAGATSATDRAQFSNQVWATEYCDRNGANCGTFESTAEERILKTNSIKHTDASTASLTAARNYWNGLVNATDSNGTSGLQSSQFKEDCTWYSGETKPSTDPGYGGETVDERLETCAAQMCKYHPTYGHSGVVSTQASHCGEGNTTSCTLGVFAIHCIY